MTIPYTSAVVLVGALLVGTNANAQAAKPRPEKALGEVASLRQTTSSPSTSLGFRGGFNDECGTAEQITVTAECAGSLFTYDATDATESQAPIICNEYTSPEARDLWFSFEATSAITLIQVEGTLTFDPVLEGFNGSCGDLTSVACADATFPPATPVNTTETLTMATEPGSIYFFRVYSYWNPAPTDFTFTLCVYEAPPGPANDLCTNVVAESLDVGAALTFTGENSGALDTEGLGQGSVWHAFTTTECANVKVDYCGTTPAFGNAFLALFIGCPFTDFVSPMDFDTETCTDGNLTINYPDLPAGTYFYAVMLDAENGAEGAYTVNVTADALSPGYCEANSEACDEYIAQVTVGNINNISECADGPIVDYTAQTLQILQSESLSITVLNGPVSYAADAVGVWVDWNRNENFCEADEYYELASADEGVTFTGTISAPGDALVGLTRMRVRMVYDMPPMACGPSDWGETEDYSVNVGLSTAIVEAGQLDWAVFPNPSNGNMTIRFGGSDAKVTIELLDVAGRAVHQEQRQLFNGQQFDLDLAGVLANGAYTLRLTSLQGRSAQKVVVR